MDEAPVLPSETLILVLQIKRLCSGTFEQLKFDDWSALEIKMHWIRM